MLSLFNDNVLLKKIKNIDPELPELISRSVVEGDVADLLTIKGKNVDLDHHERVFIEQIPQKIGEITEESWRLAQVIDCCYRLSGCCSSRGGAVGLPYHLCSRTFKQ